ncbi:hypothetical protein ACJIZ3_022494 [Penstemon smallii]|uniref:C2H2-type domain-containing protein n=1 Tax=Penstemon smallii TaxID=265156 RepID=A0ABD3TPA6_9LAMI
MFKLQSTAILLCSFLNEDDGRQTLLFTCDCCHKVYLQGSLMVEQDMQLHSAGHLLDICVRNVGWGHLEPTKGYHFADRPFVEYKGVVPHNEFQSKQKEIELEANHLISKGGKVSVIISPYDKASELCGGSLPDYISKVRIEDNIFILSFLAFPKLLLRY